jgi:hypothetical protein
MARIKKQELAAAMNVKSLEQPPPDKTESKSRVDQLNEYANKKTQGKRARQYSVAEGENERASASKMSW